MLANRITSASIRALGSVLLVMNMEFAAAAAEEPPLWTETPTHIDRSKQTYERLPAVKVERDTRTWLLVPNRIKMIDSGAFEVDKRVYRLSEIHPVQPKRYCKAIEGGRWPCGRMAMIFLGNLVRGKRLLCNIEDGGKVTRLSRCAIVSRDVATEVVVQGYGKAVTDEGPLAAAAHAAQLKAAAGLWRNPACKVDFDNC